MFGNLIGWIIAAILLVGIVLFTAFVIVPYNHLTPQTKVSLDSKSNEPLKIDVDPSSIVPMAGEGDATQQYRSAIDDVRANKGKYEQAAESMNLNTLKNLPAVKSVIEGTRVRDAQLLMKRLDENVGYSTQEADDMQAIRLLDLCLQRAGLKANEAGDTEGAKKIFEAEFALGHKMFNERINYWEAYFGIGQMRTAAQGLMIVEQKKKEKDKARIEQLQAFDTAAGELIDGRMKEMWAIIAAVDSGKINRHAGDVYAFTGPQMKEKLWRIESILKLGRHKFNVARLADQTAVPYRLADLAKAESDPAIKAAIERADKLTITEYRQIR